MQIVRIKDAQLICDRPHADDAYPHHTHIPKYNLYFKHGTVAINQDEVEQLIKAFICDNETKIG